MKAWPSTFHTAAIASTNAKEYTHLRAGAVKALRMHKSGANAQLFLALCCHPQHDPECYSLVLSVRMARKHMTAESIAPYVDNIKVTPERRRPPGPLGLLMSRLDSIGWSYLHSSTWISHASLAIDILHDPLQEVIQHVQVGFQAHVGYGLENRLGFEGLHRVDAAATVRILKNLDEVDRTLMQALQAGSFVTGDQLGRAHQEAEADWVCKFCKGQDGLRHRGWECSETEWSRKDLSITAQQWITQQPECTTLRGWMCVPQEVLDFQQHLRVKAAEVFPGWSLPQWQSNQTVYIFTDGAGKDPTRPQSRLVAWAWCFATQVGSEDIRHGASGSLPGRWQTVVRAELMAIIHAMESCVMTGLKAVIFSDNQGIVAKAQLLSAGSSEVDEATADSDLWTRFQRVVQIADCEWTFVHVYSHQEVQTLNTLDAWICWGNECADRLASQTLQQLAGDTMQLQDRASRAQDTAVKAFEEMVQHMVRVSQQSIREIEQPTAEPVNPTMHSFVNIEKVVDAAADNLPVTMRADWTHKWLQWFRSIEDANEAPCWVSWLELLIHWQLVTQEPGVESVPVEGSTRRHWRLVTKPTTHTMKQLTRSFSNMGWHVIRIGDPTHKAVQGRPQFHRVQVWVNVLPVRISSQVLRMVHDWWNERRLGALDHTKKLDRRSILSVQQLLEDFRAAGGRSPAELWRSPVVELGLVAAPVGQGELATFQRSPAFGPEECGILPFMCCEAYFGWAEKLELLGGRPWDLPCGCGLAHHCEARHLPDQMQVGTASTKQGRFNGVDLRQACCSPKEPTARKRYGRRAQGNVADQVTK
eukprot:Skav232621  [mRNA]  locus=scaffold12:20289:25288:+ [translate_table: standard]